MKSLCDSMEKEQAKKEHSNKHRGPSPVVYTGIEMGRVASSHISKESKLNGDPLHSPSPNHLTPVKGLLCFSCKLIKRKDYHQIIKARKLLAFPIKNQEENMAFIQQQTNNTVMWAHQGIKPIRLAYL